jgi:hypothetical protein
MNPMTVAEKLVAADGVRHTAEAVGGVSGVT